MATPAEGRVKKTAEEIFTIPKPPKFATVEEERRHRKERLAAGFRLFSQFGFDEGVAGHITARDPERTDHFWVNPFGVHFSQICVSNLILVNHNGEAVEGEHPVNAAAFAIHSQVHRARPDVVGGAQFSSLVYIPSRNQKAILDTHLGSQHLKTRFPPSTSSSTLHIHSFNIFNKPSGLGGFVLQNRFLLPLGLAW